MKKAPKAAIAEVKPVIAADSFLGLAQARASIRGRHQPVDLLAHDVGDHLEGRRVADAGSEEQHQEHREEAPERSRLVLDAEEVEHAEHAGHHGDEHPQRDAPAAPSVGHPAGRRARQRAHERTEEDEGQRLDRRELRLRQQREAGRVADERAKGSGVEPAHQPVVLALEDDRLLAERGLGQGDVVHAEPGEESARGDERHPDEAGILQPQRHLPGGALDHRGLAAEPAEHAGRDRDRHQELHDADVPRLPRPALSGERVAFLSLRKVERDVGHRGSEVSAA